MSSIKSLTEGERKAFLDSFDVVLSDCDGVLWTEMEPIIGSPEAVATLKKIGKKFFFITNHNGKTTEELAEKCRQLSYAAVKDDILSTSNLVAIYLKERNFSKKVYVFGMDGIARELDAVGIKHCGVGPDAMSPGESDVEVVTKFKPDPEVGAVVVGMDPDMSFPKFIKAATYARDLNVLFIGTNPDLAKPSPDEGDEAVNPGDGCLIRAIELAAGRRAVVLGKPEPFVGEIIRSKYGVDPLRTLMIGDNPKTDILLGKRCGFKTLLVLTGLTSLEKLEAMKFAEQPSCPVPDYYADRLSDIFPC